MAHFLCATLFQGGDAYRLVRGLELTPGPQVDWGISGRSTVHVTDEARLIIDDWLRLVAGEQIQIGLWNSDTTVRLANGGELAAREIELGSRWRLFGGGIVSRILKNHRTIELLATNEAMHVNGPFSCRANRTV